LKAILVLTDGTVFEGESIGIPGRTLGEVVFSTGMVGYQQAFTDPSFRGQILTLTYPLIGNYGTNDEDYESPQCQIAGLVVKEICEAPSNFRSTESLGDFLKRHNVIGVKGVDTRALTRKLRDVGVMMGAISTDETPAEALQRIKDNPGYGDTDFVQLVSTAEPYEWRPPHPSFPSRGLERGGPQNKGEDTERLRIAVIDYGIRVSILGNLYLLGCLPIVLPCSATADEVLALKPDGVLLSPGPGDPARLGPQVEAVRQLLGKKPILGICLGNQLIGHAIGGKTFKLKFGHRGGNHPVQCRITKRVRITSQNHGYAVDADSLAKSPGAASQINLNDGTVEGIECPDLRAFSIQYHAEASPGPLDSRGIFGQFVQRIREPERWEQIEPEVC
jgi:carbamoyl-phosphate synthase small subunit